MNSLRFALSLLALVAVTNGCAKKASTATSPSTNSATPVADANISVSNKTATGFTLTWPAASDSATASADLEYKVVRSTSNNLTTVANAEANGTLVMDWTANTLTTNVSSLSNSTTYYIAVLVRDTDGDIGLANTFTTTLCAGKRIFLATASNGNLGGKTGADSICNAQKPAGMGTVKAMVSDSSGINTSTGLPSNLNGRQACYGDCRSTTLYTLDWVFAGGQRYCTSDYESKVADTNASYPVPTITQANVLSASAVTLYAGFNIYFGNAYDNNCSNWTSTSGSFVAGSTSGIYSGSTNTFITGGNFPSCASAASIVCVEQ